MSVATFHPSDYQLFTIIYNRVLEKHEYTDDPEKKSLFEQFMILSEEIFRVSCAVHYPSTYRYFTNLLRSLESLEIQMENQQ